MPTPSPAALMITLVASAPISDSGLPMVTLSAYVPAATLIVSFADAAATAAPMVAMQPDEAGAVGFTQNDAAFMGAVSATPDSNIRTRDPAHCLVSKRDRILLCVDNIFLSPTI